MKKLFYLLLVLIFFVSGCNNNSEDELLKVANDILDNISIEEDIDSDIDLPTSGNTSNDIEYTIKWTSNNPGVITNDGKITKGLEDVEVTITASINIDGIKTSRDFVVKVLKDEDLIHQREIEVALNNTLDSIQIDEIIDEDIVLQNEFTILGEKVEATWVSSDPYALTNDGKITRTDLDVNVTLEFTITFAGITKNKVIKITVLRNEKQLEVEKIAEEFDLGITETYQDINLPKEFNGAEVDWFTSNKYVLTKDGIYGFVEEDTEVTLTALFVLDDFYFEKDIIIKAIPIPHQVRLEMVAEKVTIPQEITQSITLETVFDYEVTGSWSSSDEEIIDVSGNVFLSNTVHNIRLTLLLKSGDKSMTKVFEVKTKAIDENHVQYHNFIDRAVNFESEKMENVEVSSERLILKTNAIEGYYESGVYTTNLFTSLVGSWAAISDANATVEFMIKVRVDGTWSKYLSYRPWGLGLNNSSVNDSDSIASISIDEVLVKNGKKADAFQYKIILKRTNSNYESPKLSLVSVTLNIPDYIYPVSTTDFPSFVDYDVPMLNQQAVPNIGDSICSITSSTMLLNYKGHSFLEHDVLEHRYIAALFKDYGAGIYGNWVFNTVGMSSYGENTYVNRMYSFEELQQHLINVGPIAASIKGNVGLYSTNGHLIVVRGYRINDDGKTFVIVNDPNINSRFGNDSEGNPLFVYYEYPLEVFMSVWRGVNYVIE